MDRKMALAETSDWGRSSSIIDPNIFVSSFREIWLNATKVLPDNDSREAVASGDKMLALSQAQKAIVYYQSALQKNQNYMDARVGVAVDEKDLKSVVRLHLVAG